MSTTHSVDQVEAYITEVRNRLVGIPDDECAELLDDVSAHVREVAREHGADQLVERLGAPEKFGDELRAAAGFKAAQPPSSVDRWWSELRLPTLPNDRIAPVWARLEPAWWVLRGVLVAQLVLWAANVEDAVIPRIGTSRLLGLVALVFGGGVSYVLGDRRPTGEPARRRRIRIVAELALVLFGVAHVAQASDTQYVYVDNGQSAVGYDQCLRDSAGRPIGNLYAFDSTGKLIPQFFLTDQAGRGIDNLCPDDADADHPNGPAKTTYARDVNGAQVFNVFPRAQQRSAGTDPMTGERTGSGAVPPPAVLFPQLEPPGVTATAGPPASTASSTTTPPTTTP